MTRFSKPISCIALAGLLLAANCVQADEFSDVDRLFGDRQYAEVIQRADRYLAANPKDARMRFLKGLALSEQGKSAEAIDVFVKLNADHPELPEPYNNLAVLYGKQGQYEQARKALEAAIRTNPSYATAYENLGDVYAKLASQAYSKALQIDGTNQKLNPKLAMIRELFPSGASAGAATSQAKAPAANAGGRTPAATTATAAAIATTKPAAAASTAPASATSASSAAAARPAPAVAADTKGPEAAALAWASAWSRKDMNAYFAAYTRDFPKGRSRKSWESERRARITEKRSIDVDLSNIVVQVKGDEASVSFKQDYKADSLKITGRKRLDMVKVSGQWLIAKESTGS